MRMPVDEMRELVDLRNQRELKPEEAERLRNLAEQTNSPKAGSKKFLAHPKSVPPPM